MSPSPIALFAYNRPAHTRRTIEALQRNEFVEQSDLYVFCDGSKSSEDVERVEQVRAYVEQLSGFKSVQTIKRPRNLGLAESVMTGVTEVCGRCGRVIVLEDDLVTSRWFLRYMNEALELYESDSEVISIHGYVYPVPSSLPETFFIKGADCWGWATWQRGWSLFNPDGKSLLAELEDRKLTSAFDFDNASNYTSMLRGQIAGRNNSWAVRWYASAFLQDKLTLYPGRSLVQNIGFDSSGVHGSSSHDFEVELSRQPLNLQRLPLRENGEARHQFQIYFRHGHRSRLQRFWHRVSRSFTRSTTC